MTTENTKHETKSNDTEIHRLYRRRFIKTTAVSTGLVGLSGIGASQGATDFVDILSADPSDYPNVLLNISVDTEAGRSGELSREDFEIAESGVKKAIRNFTFSSVAADIVFVFDDTSSMGGEISDMKAGVKDLTDGIEDAGINARYSLISFKDTVETDLAFTENADQLKSEVDTLSAVGGGDGPEDNFDAIVQALGLDFRIDAQKILVDITDDLSHYRGDGTDFSNYTIDEVVAQLNESGVAYIAVAPDRNDPNASKKVLADRTDGLWIDIQRADFSKILDRIETLVATAYVLEYSTDTPRGESRDIGVTVTDPNAGTDTDSTTVAVPPDPAPPIEPPEGERTLMITGNAPTEYTLTVDGTLEADTYGGSFRAEENDEPTENSDGTLTRSDETGPVPDRASETNYLGDRFLFTGSVVELDVPTGSGPPDVNLYLDEEDVSREEILDFEDASGETHTLMITGNAPTEYTLTVDGTLEVDTYGGDFAAEDNDTPTENSDGTLTRSDETGPVPDRAAATNYLGDRFIVTGRVTELDLPTGDGSPDVNVYLDEELVTPDDVVADGST